MKHPWLIIPLTLSLLNAETFYFTKDNKKVYFTPIQQQRTVGDTNITYYRDRYGNKVGVSDQVLTGCNKDDACATLFKRYPVQKSEKIAPHIYLLTLRSDADVFEVSQKLHHESLIEFAHPNLFRRKVLR